MDGSARCLRHSRHLKQQAEKLSFLGGSRLFGGGHFFVCNFVSGFIRYGTSHKGAELKANLSDVIAKFHPEVRARYDFSGAAYHGALKRMTGLVCPQHGEFTQYPAQLRKNGAGCPTCGDLVRRAKRRTPAAEVIARASARHGGFYTYDRAVYVNNSTKFTVTCPLHGDFDITPNGHVSGGKGCPVCGANKRGHRLDVNASGRKTADAKLAKFAAKFQDAARAVHGDLYDYSRVAYKGQKTKVTILCPSHGPFDQTPEHHTKRAQGCPECSHHRSKGEAALAKFVSIFGPISERDRSVISPKELDIYVPWAKVAIEYCGEYWHAASSPEDERKSRTRHTEKHRTCAAAGVRLLTVYESEWHENPFAIKRLIRNAIGKARGRVMARKCEVSVVGNVEAAAFFDRYHPQGGSGWGLTYGLRYRGKLVACMRFAFGANDRGAGAERMWTLTRYATRVSVAGGASRLFAAFAAEHQPDCVKSFSDNRYFTGAMYEKLGFVLEAETGPDYKVYHPKTGLLPKSAWQRKNIPARIRDLGSNDKFHPSSDPRSERDMTYSLGAQRLFDCGKKRWVWNAEKQS